MESMTLAVHNVNGQLKLVIRGGYYIKNWLKREGAGWKVEGAPPNTWVVPTILFTQLRSRSPALPNLLSQHNVPLFIRYRVRANGIPEIHGFTQYMSREMGSPMRLYTLDISRAGQIEYESLIQRLKDTFYENGDRLWDDIYRYHASIQAVAGEPPSPGDLDATYIFIRFSNSSECALWNQRARVIWFEDAPDAPGHSLTKNMGVKEFLQMMDPEAAQTQFDLDFGKQTSIEPDYFVAGNRERLARELSRHRDLGASVTYPPGGLEAAQISDKLLLQSTLDVMSSGVSGRRLRVVGPCLHVGGGEEGNFKGGRAGTEGLAPPRGLGGEAWTQDESVLAGERGGEGGDLNSE
uniref:Uncharacterized protein n=1 Tax=Chromera velia CCMP2878 TaxID=1169474 RepID=A0A0G4HGA8_9ALVE|eukprot:Cvel_27152.t1-p1 / transcript=Cvel_27152.t1 / gene=Cvel_27152 / organism=Chromera_velia_CCMP2878 / gene_product=hypothetical protein / transcript_product=hypothetical protein / location=Cvel_scaffold3342:6292-9692(-) / protein_length=350 / sequence_SO=supercontig / SO=protein_coding / is_pseudo=false